MRDLWPNDIWETENVSVPSDILKEQAAFLGHKTKNFVTAEVITFGRSYYDNDNEYS
jgi:hypothetical protein